MFTSQRKSVLRQRHRVLLLLEWLEDRIAPSVTYDWVGGNPGDPNKWEESKNWSGGTAGQYPGFSASDDIARFRGAKSTTTYIDLNSSRQIGALISDDAFNQVLWINGSYTLTVFGSGTTTDWHGGDIEMLNTGSQLQFEAGTATFSGSTQNSTGNLNPLGYGGDVGTVWIWNAETVTFKSNFSHFGANIILGYPNGQTPTKGNLTFDSSLAANVTDDRSANITVDYGTLTFSSGSENSGGIVYPQPPVGGWITLASLLSQQGEMDVTNGAGTFVKVLPIDNSSGILKIKGGGLHITGGFADPGQPDDDCSYVNYSTSGNPTLSLDNGSELKLDHQFYMNIGTVQVSSGHAQIDASDAKPFQFAGTGGTIDVSKSGSTSDYLTLNSSNRVTCTKLGIKNTTDNTTCSYIKLAGGATWALGGVPVVTSTMNAGPNTSNFYTIVSGATGGPSTSSTGTGFGMWIYNGTNNNGDIKWKLGSQSRPEVALQGSATNAATGGPAIFFQQPVRPVRGQVKSYSSFDPPSTKILDQIYCQLAAAHEQNSGWAEMLLGDGSRWLLFSDVPAA
jgi:hypothetical protein